MKKIKRLIEIKRQRQLQRAKMERARLKDTKLAKERDEILNAVTKDEWNLYKEKIERACRL